MADSPATTADLTKRSLRPLKPNEVTWGEIRLVDAFNQLVGKHPAVGAKLDLAAPGSVYEQNVVQVQVAMVLRVLANPDYLRQAAIDDSTSILDQAVSSGALYASDDEVALLTASADGTDGAWSVRAMPVFGTPTNPIAPFTGTMGNIL